MAATGRDELIRSLVDLHPEDAARFIEGLEGKNAARIVARLPDAVIGKLAEHLSPEGASAVLAGLEDARTRALLAKLPARRAAAVLARLEDARREGALAGLPPRTARQLRELLLYPPGTAGSLMDTQVTSLRMDHTAREAVAKLRRSPRSTLVYLYVTDADGKLVGVLNMRELLLAAPSDPIEPLVRRSLASLSPVDDAAAVTHQLEETRLIALPVIDEEGHLLGVVRHEELLDTVRQEAFADLQKMVGAGGDERALSPASVVVRKRLPWLYVNLGTAFLAASVVGLFEDTIAQVTALAILLPIVAGQGGNTGAQALAVVMRGIALHEVQPSNRARLLRKELLGAFVNGSAVAAGTAGAVFLWDGRIGLALVIGLAMVVNMTAAGLAGASIPMMLQALGRDPAQSSSIFMTTVTDVVGFASFLGFAVLFMPMLQT